MSYKQILNCITILIGIIVGTIEVIAYHDARSFVLCGWILIACLWIYWYGINEELK